MNLLNDGYHGYIRMMYMTIAIVGFRRSELTLTHHWIEIVISPW